MAERMSWDDVMHFIAQGAINIDEGLTTIEPGSRIHQAMHELCRLVTLGRIKPPLEVTRYHLVVTKHHLIDEISEHGAACVLKDWDGTDQEAIARIEEEDHDYFTVGNCDNRGTDGRCLGHDEEDENASIESNKRFPHEPNQSAARRALKL